MATLQTILNEDTEQALALLKEQEYTDFFKNFNQKYQTKCSDPMFASGTLDSCFLGMAIVKNDLSAFKYFLEEGNFPLWKRVFINMDAINHFPEEEMRENAKKYCGQQVYYLELATFLNRNQMVECLIKKNDDRISSFTLQECADIAFGNKNKTLCEIFNSYGIVARIRPTQQQVAMLYQTVTMTIAKAYLETLTQNKKFIILLGEDHVSIESFYIKNIIIDICQILGISNLLTELCDERLHAMLNDPSSQADEDLLKISLNQAVSKSMDIYPIDVVSLNIRSMLGFYLFNFIKDPEIQENELQRELTIARLSYYLSQDALMVNGLAHLVGLLKFFKTQPGFEVMPMIITETTHNTHGLENGLKISLPGNYNEFSAADIKEAFEHIHSARNAFLKNIPKDSVFFSIKPGKFRSAVELFFSQTVKNTMGCFGDSKFYSPVPILYSFSNSKTKNNKEERYKNEINKGVMRLNKPRKK